MYETYYRLSADPFRLSPDPRFCFEHPSFARARKYMQYALRRAEGFIMVTGRPGTGKTTLVESLLAGLAGGGPVAARLVTAQLGPDELLRKVAYAFGLNVGGLDKATLLLHLERFLTQQARTGRGALLVLDEAQGLGASALEELRLLTNLQENARPILQIFLVGQEELRDIVQRPELEQFHQRLIAACHLRPLDLAETRAYVEHRLRRVGWRGDPGITSDALELVHRFSVGVPRRINQICSRLLLHGAAEDRHRLNGHDALAVIEDLRAELLAPADIAEADELRDLLASLPKELEPPPPLAEPASRASGQPPPQGSPGQDEVRQESAPAPLPPASLPPPAPERASAGQPAAAAAEAGAVAAPSPAALPPQPASVATWPAAPAQRSSGAGAGQSRNTPRDPGRGPDVPAPDVLAAVTYASFLPPQVPGQPSGAVHPRPAYRAPRRPRRRLASLLVASLLIAAAAVPLTVALFPSLTETLRTEVGHWLARTRPGPEGAPSPATGTVTRRVDVATPTSPAAADPARSPTATSPASRAIPATAEPAAPPVASEVLTPLPPQPVPSVRSDPHPASDAGDVPPPRSEPLQRPEVLSGPIVADHPPAPQTDTSARIEAAAAPQPPAPVGSVRDATPGVTAAQSGAAPEATSAGQPDPEPEATGPERELARLGLSSRRLDDGTVHVNLRQQVPFDFNSAEVRPESRPFLDRLADVLRRLDGFVVRVVGLTDDSGTRGYNAQLSRRRAEAVASYLRQQGVPTDRLRAEGRGAGEPTAELTGIVDGGADRRRIELYIQPLANSRA